MSIEHQSYVEPLGVKGKVILTSFPGLDDNKIFQQNIFINQLSTFVNLNCSTIVSLVEDSEFDQLCEKKLFVRNIYNHNLKWIHMPIADLKAPDHEFKQKWITTKTLLKNDLLKGKNIVLHCKGGIGRSGTIAALILIEHGEENASAMKRVRKKRQGAIENELQEQFVLDYKTII